jgi:hypothetical protein
MTPNDVPGPTVTTESLQAWLIALAPVEEPVRPLRPRLVPAPPEPLRPAA